MNQRKNVKTNKGHNQLDTMDITPNYQGFFSLAIEIAKSQVGKDNGQDLIVEMLEYGQRMDALLQEDFDVIKEKLNKEGK